MGKERKPFSLKWGLTAVMAACWVIPIVTIVIVAGVLLNRNYEQSLCESITASVGHAMEQTTLQLDNAMEASKAVSYNGEIREAYRAYQQSGDRQALYNRVYAYFSQNFSRDTNFKAVFLTFNDHPDMLYYYADSFRANTYRLSQHFRADVQPQVEETLEAVDTGIFFLEDDGELYMTRNLLDASFHPYAQEAIRLGVTRFLLKPSKMDEIHEALGAMKANLDRRARQDEPAEESETQQQAENFLVNQAIAYIRAHYREKLSLQEVADRCYISQWHLSKQLNRCAGKSFYDILNSVRIEEACKLLADPSLKIGEISELVGYADVAHFARTFKKLEGVSANEYRNKL